MYNCSNSAKKSAKQKHIKTASANNVKSSDESNNTPSNTEDIRTLVENIEVEEVVFFFNMVWAVAKN